MSSETRLGFATAVILEVRFKGLVKDIAKAEKSAAKLAKKRG